MAAGGEGRYHRARALASERFGCRPWKAGRRETYRSGWDHPRQGDDGKPAGPDGGVTLLKRSGFLNTDVEDAQPAELRCAVQQRAGGEQMASLVQVREVGQVRVLQRIFLFRREFWCVIAEHKQRDREPVEVHGRQW